MKLNVASFLEASTLDYPGNITAVLWLCGCPFRCPFCQNAPVALGEECNVVDIDEIIEKIVKVRAFIDAVTITGGEPLMQDDSLIEFLRRVKNLGVLTHVNTNGFYPKALEKALPFLDYISIDVKNELVPKEYEKAIKTDGEKAVLNLKRSLDILKDKGEGKTIEVRTTIVPGLVEDPEIISKIAKDVNWADLYVLQRFRNCTVIDQEYKKIKEPDDEFMDALKKAAEKNNSNVVVR